MKDNQRITITKRMLQEGMVRLLKNKSLDKIKVIELCEESGINRATFYRHYAIPRDVLDEMRRNTLYEIETLIRHERSDDNMQKELETICQYCYDHSEQLKILFANRTDEGFTQLLNELYQEHLPEIRKVQQEYHIDSVDMKLASYYYAGGFFMILRQWLTENIEKTPSEIAALIYQFISGLKGIES